MKVRLWGLVGLLLVGALALGLGGHGTRAEEPLPALLTGSVYDSQGQPVEGASVALHTAQPGEALSEAVTQSNGLFALLLPEAIPDSLTVRIDRPHFEETGIELSLAAIEALRAEQSVVLPDTTLTRQTSLAFWLATLIFVGMLVIIATGVLHNTLATLVGTSLVLAVSYLGSPLSEGFSSLTFRERWAMSIGM